MLISTFLHEHFGHHLDRHPIVLYRIHSDFLFWNLKQLFWDALASVRQIPNDVQKQNNRSLMGNMAKHLLLRSQGYTGD